MEPAVGDQTADGEGCFGASVGEADDRYEQPAVDRHWQEEDGGDWPLTEAPPTDVPERVVDGHVT